MQTLSSIGVELLKALSPVLLALISWGALKVSALIQAKVKSQQLESILLRINSAAEHAVKEVEQTFVSGLDENAPADSMKKAKDLAVESVKKMLGPAGLKDFASLLGVSVDDASVAAALASIIESKVHDLKLSKKPA
jgi:hypothetical protein